MGDEFPHCLALWFGQYVFQCRVWQKDEPEAQVVLGFIVDRDHCGSSVDGDQSHDIIESFVGFCQDDGHPFPSAVGSQMDAGLAGAKDMLDVFSCVRS